MAVLASHYVLHTNSNHLPILWVVMVIPWWWIIISPGHHGVSARRGWNIGIPVLWHRGWSIKTMTDFNYKLHTAFIFFKQGTGSFSCQCTLFQTLTSIHGARWGRSLGWRASIANWGSSLHWRGASGWHSFKGVSIIIIFTDKKYIFFIILNHTAIKGYSQNSLFHMLLI